MRLKDYVVAQTDKGEITGRIWGMRLDGSLFDILPDGELSLTKLEQVKAEKVRMLTPENPIENAAFVVLNAYRKPRQAEPKHIDDYA